jgi:hypothetical protein
VGLVPAPANIHVEAFDPFGMFEVVRERLRGWLRDSGYTSDMSRPADMRIGLLCYFNSSEWVAAGIPYIAVSTEQLGHYAHLNGDSAEWFSNAVAVWCMDVLDAALVCTRYGKPVSVLPYMIATFTEGVSYAEDAASGSAVHAGGGGDSADVDVRTILHLGTRNERRTELVVSVANALNALPQPLPFMVVLNVSAPLFKEPARSHLIASSRVVIVPNYYGNAPCMYTVHRLAYTMHVRHPQLRVVVEECADARISGALVVALHPMVRVVSTEAFGAAVVAAVSEPDWSDEECAQHTARIATLFSDVLARTPRAGETWLPRAVYDALVQSESDDIASGTLQSCPAVEQ